eukprot:4289035-Karenia_brevis.AAC.1
MVSPAASRSRSRSPKDRTPNQPATSSNDLQGSSHTPILPLKQNSDDSDWDSDATQEYIQFLTQQCQLAGKEYIQLLQRSEEARRLSTSPPAEVENHYHVMPDCSHTISWNGSRPPSPNPGVTATYVSIVEFAVGGMLKPWFVHDSHVRALSVDEVHVVRFYASGYKEVIIERQRNVLTLQEALKYAEQ